MDRLVQQGTTDAHPLDIGMDEQVDDEGATQLWIPDRLSHRPDCSYGPALETSTPREVGAKCPEFASEGVVHLLLCIGQSGSCNTGRVGREVGVGECVTIRQLDRAQLHCVDGGGGS